MAVTEADVVQAARPRDVGAESINICNARCTFCGYGKGPDGKAADARRKGKLSADVFRHTLRLYSAAGGGVFALSPILGEVSADPRWLDMVREARSFDNITGVSCFTNAILLHRFGADAIVTAGITHMALSTSLGSAEQYRRLYGVDKYDQVVANILDLLRANQRHGAPVDISIHLRIDKPFSRFFRSDIYAELLKYVPASRIQILDDGWDDFKGLIGSDGLPGGQQFKVQYPDKSVPCYAIYRKLQVLKDGTIQGCSCRIEPDLWVGNIMDFDSMEAAWRNPAFEALRANWHAGTIPNSCKNCSHYEPYTNLLRAARPVTVARAIVGKLKRVLGRA